jgi:flagellar biosynthesis chaperone FliJ
MKKNEFNLETLLEVRRAQETAARQELSSSLARQLAALNNSVEAKRDLNRMMHQIAEGSAGRFSSADREREWAVQQAQQTRCAELEAALKECERITEGKRAAAVDAHRKCELLERLKKLRQDEAAREANRAEQCLFDELAMTRSYQASREASSIC